MIIYFMNFLWLVTSLFLILIILVQRGKGGGLAGALGGVGGSSAFGTRAGDLFTKITVGVFVVWLLLAIALVPLMTQTGSFQGGTQVGPSNPTASSAEPLPAAAGTEGAGTEAPGESPAAATETPAGTEPAAETTPTPSAENAPSADAPAAPETPAAEPKAAESVPAAQEPKDG